MQKETIIHNNRKVTKTTKNNGTISYTQRGVYIGIDVKTGKKSPHPSLPKLYEVLTENHAG